MPQTYKFTTAPEYNYKTSRVILSFEDFFKIMELAEDQLNSGAKLELNVGAFPEGAKQQIYIDKLMVNHSKNSTSMELGQPSSLQQNQLKATFATPLSHISQISHILKSSDGQKLSKNPLDFLSVRLGKFKSASLIFWTQPLMPKTAVAPEFHAACDNQPNVLVIIKSGQYIAGGFTAVAFESHSGEHWKPNPDFSTFLFSINKQKLYPLVIKDKALNCNQQNGPRFGFGGLCLENNYASSSNWCDIHSRDSSFYDSKNIEGELFGTRTFTIDSYEVFQLQ